MSIRQKLFLIVLVIFLGALVTVAINFAISAPMKTIAAELAVLERLENALKATRTETALMDSQPFLAQQQNLAAVRKELESAFDGMNGLRLIPRLSTSTAEAVTAVVNLKNLLSTELATLDGVSADVLADAKVIFMTDAYFSLRDFYLGSILITHEKRGEITLHLEYMFNALFALNLNLEASVSRITQQKEAIKAEIAAMNGRITAVTLAISILLMAGVFLGVLRIAGGIARAVRAIESRIRLMKDGDLTIEFPSQSKDELGRLSANLNDFTRSLRESIGGIKRSSQSTMEVEEELAASTRQTSASINEIDASAQSVHHQIDLLDTQVRTSNAAMGQVLQFVSTLDGRLQEQTSMVEESTASVTEMIASIGSVADITGKKREATERLVETTREGGDRLQATNAVISEINRSIDDISSTASLIQGIANQTNLLAMNAAIEAAHAGDAGRGFSVVADEIRKLAEAASKNSKHIAGVLKQIVVKIEEAAAAGIRTGEVFADINTEVRDVVHSFTEIASNMAELSSGSRQILTAMNSLQDLSLEVKQDGRNMAESTERSRAAMETAERISTEVLGNITEIGLGIGEVSIAVNAVNTLAGKVNTVTQVLNDAVRGFVTETAETSAPETAEDAAPAADPTGQP